MVCRNDIKKNKMAGNNLTEKEETARRRLCLALDTPTIYDGIRTAYELADLVGLFKIGKILHTDAVNEGVPFIRLISENGRFDNIFLDLKFNDIPNTVHGAAKASAVPGVRMFNLHVDGGEAMCKKAVEGAYEGSHARGIARPYVIGVTVLTSHNDDTLAAQGLGVKYSDLVRHRTELARKWGLDGVVCAANQAGALEKEFGSGFLYVTPGIESGGRAGADQKQLYTPDRAVQDCSNSILVTGRAILTALDRRAAAYDMLQAMSPYV